MSLIYQNATLADLPVLYYRLDMVGLASNGDEIPDISGNDLHGTLQLIPTPTPPYGYASPIETDAASREFLGNNDPFVGAARILRGSDSLIEPAGNFALEGWLRPLPPGASHSPQMYFGKGSGNPNFPFTNCFFIGTNFNNSRLVGGMWDSAQTLWTVTDSRFGGTTDAILDGKSYHVVLERRGNALSIYVNGLLGGTTTITSGLPTLVTSDPFFIHCPQTAPMRAGYDEVALYDPVPSATRWLVHYEAALNTLRSSATITVRVAVSLDTDSIEPVDFAVAHNWTEPISGQERVITEHLSWKTHRNRSEPDYEQRVNARPRGPRRSLEYAITPTTPLARAMFQQALFQPAQVFKLPILTDWVPLTATANASDLTLNCDTTLRDFEIGSHCVAFTDPYDPATFQFFKITSCTDSQLGVSPAVGATITNGLIAPARLAHLPGEDAQLEAYVIDRETGILKFDILDTELSSRRVTTYTPTSTYQPNLAKPAVEVFSLDIARFDTLETTPYSITQRQLGTGNLTGNDYFRGLDTATSSTISARVLIVSRETLSEFYGWLDARQGRQNPVWIPSGENDLTLIAQLSATILRIAAGYSFYNLHYGRRDVQLTFSDGTVANRRIAAVTKNGNGTEDITVASLPAGAVTKISWLRYCVAPDSFELRFHRDLATAGGMVVECAWEFSELLTTP